MSLSLEARQQQLGQGYRCRCERCQEESLLEPQEAVACSCGRLLQVKEKTCACGRKFKCEESIRHLEEVPKSLERGAFASFFNAFQSLLDRNPQISRSIWPLDRPFNARLRRPTTS